MQNAEMTDLFPKPIGYAPIVNGQTSVGRSAPNAAIRRIVLHYGRAASAVGIIRPMYAQNVIPINKTGGVVVRRLFV